MAQFNHFPVPFMPGTGRVSSVHTEALSEAFAPDRRAVSQTGPVTGVEAQPAPEQRC
jgi:hypothetical protein